MIRINLLKPFKRLNGYELKLFDRFNSGHLLIVRNTISGEYEFYYNDDKREYDNIREVYSIFINPEKRILNERLLKKACDYYRKVTIVK